MDRTYHSLSSERYDRSSVDTDKDWEQRIFITELLHDKNSKIPLEHVLAFERFLVLPEIDEKIEIGAEHHRFPGSHAAYQDSIYQVAKENFPIPGANIEALIEIHSFIYNFSKSSEFKQRVQEIIAMKELERTPTEVPNILLDEILEEIEEIHLKEMSDEDMTQYSMKNRHDRLAIWENRLFPNDPLYWRLKLAKSKNDETV